MLTGRDAADTWYRNLSIDGVGGAGLSLKWRGEGDAGEKIKCLIPKFTDRWGQC
jgi:hypothetical protein